MSPCSSDCIFRAPARSGVQSLRILGCYQLLPSDSSEPSAPVHRERGFEELAEPSERPMVAQSHLSHDPSERDDVRLLRRQERVTFEERNDSLEQVASPPDDQYERSVLPAVAPDRPASEPRLDQLQYLRPVAVLADMELRDELEADAAARVALHRDGEASFSVDVIRDVAVQPFLLIVRTRHVVTIVNVRPDDTMSSAGFSEFPAYSRIYRQHVVYCLTTF